MKRFIAILSAGIIALLSFSSCDFEWADNSGTAEAFLTCYYAGGLPSVTASQAYDLDDTYLSKHDIEDIFDELSEVVRPGFIDAVLEIHIYDSYDHYQKTRTFAFWWDTGEGDYTHEEIE